MFKTGGKSVSVIAIATFLLAMMISTGTALAANPVVKTVPWVPSNPLLPHDTWLNKTITLKGTTDVQGTGITFSWDFGDGTTPATGNVTNMYAVEATHAYTTGTPGATIYTATLTITNSNPGGGSATTNYYVKIQNKSLQVEVNVAIDEGLWFLHKDMTRVGDAVTGYGYWAHYYNTETPANLNAFFVNGHLETGASSNPYTETVQRGMRRLFTLLTPMTISNQTYDVPIGTVNPDSNGNGIGIYGYDSYNYSSGIFIDAIVSSGTPNAMTTTGATNVINRKYMDIVQDMVDFDAFSQTDSGTWMGGWGYGYNYGASDNSVNQWEVIGLLAAKGWGAVNGVGGVVVPSFISQANVNSLNNTHTDQAWDGTKYTETYFNYTNNGWSGWYFMGTTPAGMVQMVFDGIGRGNALWDRTENFIRNNYCTPTSSGPTATPRAYYYGLFSLTKSMLLYPGGSQLLYNQYPTANSNPIDWYAAQVSAGDQCNGVARTLVTDQNAAGNWSCHGGCGYHDYFETAWAIIMLNRTVYTAVPVAVAVANPNPALVNQIITLDGSGSYDQDPTKSIVKWEWSINGGPFVVGPAVTTTSFGALNIYPVTLRVTDSAGTTASTTIQVSVTVPPTAPTANAGGPYNFCPGAKPWYLDGTKSINPDNGQHQTNQINPPITYPGDYIKAYDWDLTGNGLFNDATGSQPNVTAFFTSKGVGNYLIQLRVTDNTALSFPASGLGDLTGTASSQVNVLAATDPKCAGCITNLGALAKNKQVQLTWSLIAGIDHYNVYRGTTSGGPYTLIGTASSTQTVYFDYTVTNGTTYYYVVRPAVLNGNEKCQSNQVSALPKLTR
jgi:hypothetical protein